MKSTVGSYATGTGAEDVPSFGRTLCASGAVVRAATCRDTTRRLKPLSLRLNFSWVAAGNAVETGCQWGLVVALAHLGNLEMIGTVVLAFAVCAPVNALACLGLRGALVTDARREFQFGDYLALRLATAALALLVVAAIVLSAEYGANTALVILVVALGEFFRAIRDIFHALLQQHERMDRVAISQMIRGPAILLVLSLGVFLTQDLLWGVLAFPLVTAATLFGYDLPAGARMIRGSQPGPGDAAADDGSSGDILKPRWNVHTLLKLAWLTLPLGIVLMLISLSTSVPRYMIDHCLGTRALGVFVSVFYLAMVGARVVTALGQSAGPRLAKHLAAGDTTAYFRLLGRLLAIVLALGAGVTLVVAAAGGPILRLLYDHDFTAHLDLAVYLMAAGAAMYLTIPLGIAVEAMRRFRTHMIVRAVGVAVLLATLPALIHAWQLTGAAIAMLISSACSAIGCGLVVLWAFRHGGPIPYHVPSSNTAPGPSPLE